MLRQLIPALAFRRAPCHRSLSRAVLQLHLYSSNAEPVVEHHIKSWKDGSGLGRIAIDRPKALNAMTAGKP